MGIDDGWSKGGRCYERLRRTIGPDFGDGVLDAIDRRDTELARVEAERDAALAKVAAVRAVCDGWENDLFTEAQHAYSQDEAGQHREDYNAIVEALATEDE